jgi:2-haloacid dehalogenase
MSVVPSNPRDPIVTAVVFDLGGVLIDWNPRYLYRSIFGDEARMERFLAEVATPEWNARQDAGRPWDEAIAELTARFPAEAEAIAAYRGRWEEMLGGVFEDTIAILDELRRRGEVRLLALSNWSSETFAIAHARFPFLDWFEALLISGKVGLAKPDPAIFRLFVDRFGLDPRTTVYIDDSPVNVGAAEALGMIGITFTNADALRVELATRRLVEPVTRGRA